MNKVKRVRLPTGVDIEYEDWDPEYAARAPDHGHPGERSLVLVHGFTGSRDDWKEVLPELAKWGRTIALDQRGHGGSTKTRKAKTYSLEQLAADLDAFIAHLDCGPVDLLGHSLGGMVALRCVLAHPERVASLILMNTSPYGVPLAPVATLKGGARLGRIAGMGAIAWIMREADKRESRLAPAARRWVEEQGEDAFWERTTRRIEQMDPEGFLALGTALSEQESVEPRLPEIRCPTTVLIGEQDTAFLEPSRKLSAGIPGAVHVELPDTAHSGQQENPAAWLTAISGHLERARTPRA